MVDNRPPRGLFHLDPATWVELRAAWRYFHDLHHAAGLGYVVPLPTGPLRHFDLEVANRHADVRAAGGWVAYELAQINAGYGWPQPISPTYSERSQEESESEEESAPAPTPGPSSSSGSSSDRPDLGPAGHPNDCDGI